MVLPFQRTAFMSDLADRMPSSAMPAKFSLPFRRPPEIGAGSMTELECFDGRARVYPRYDLRQQFTVADVMPGYKTPVFAYNGSIPGPTFRLHHDKPVVVNQTNLLHRAPEPPYDGAPMPSAYTADAMGRSSSTHLHGSASLPQYDGYASDLAYPGQVKRYFYPNCQEARTLWYHDHAVHHTAQNAYNGLAGMFILHDNVEASLGIPSGAAGTAEALRYDVPLVIRDALFAKDGGLLWDGSNESGMYGDVMLINGVPWPYLNVEPRKYRFRFLNASVSRSYLWQLHDGVAVVPMTVIGTDGGLVPKPQVVKTLRQGMAERYEVIIDFAAYKGAKITLRNLLPPNNGPSEGVERAMQFRVGRTVSSTAGNVIPVDWTQRVAPAECMTWTEAGLLAQGVPVRTFEFKRSNSRWTINGETWQNVIDSGYLHSQAEPEAGAVEIWELKNSSGGWFHPVHVHLVDFQILSRNGSKANVRPHEKGPKDVVYVGENDTVRIAMRFDGPSAGEGWPKPKGRYMMHCHNLVHEDHDMMMQFNVGDPAFDPAFDPITADPAVPA